MIDGAQAGAGRQHDGQAQAPGQVDHQGRRVQGHHQPAGGLHHQEPVPDREHDPAGLPGMFFDFTGVNDKSHGLPDMLINALVSDRKSLLVTDSFRSFAFIALTVVLLWALLYNKLKIGWGFAILTGLILIDLFAVDKRYVNNDSFTSKSKAENPFGMSPADKEILKDTTLDYRVLNLTIGDLTGDYNTSYFHKSLGGYHGAKLRRYQELITYGIDPDIRELNKTRSTANTPVLNMLNTRYFIAEGQDKTLFAIPNLNALSNAWFVKNYKLVDTPDAEIASLAYLNPHDEAIVDKRFSGDLKGYSPGRSPGDTIRLESYEPNDLLYGYKTKQIGFAVFSEIYYPKGWNAYVDGKMTPHFRVNYILRAMILPAGEHKVEFKFEPKVYFVRREDFIWQFPDPYPPDPRGRVFRDPQSHETRGMKKALIITYYWPPSGGAGVQRWLKFVKYLRGFGWEPVVYTPGNPEFLKPTSPF